MKKEVGDRWRIHVDTGGTFTDCLIELGGKTRRTKVLSNGSLPGVVQELIGSRSFRIRSPWVAPDDFPVGFQVSFSNHPDCEGRVSGYQSDSGLLQLDDDLPFDPQLGEAIELISKWEAPILAAKLGLAAEGLRLDAASVAMRLATTRCTNALLEKKGTPPVFFVTRGFPDLLRIGDQRRLGLFDLQPRQREPLHAEVIEVPERMDREGSVLEPLDLEALHEPVQALLAEGRNVAAVSLLHSYANPRHEEALALFLKEAGFEVVATSAAVSPFVKWLPRAESAVVEACLAPVLSEYLANVSADLPESDLRVMTSAGGLSGVKAYRAVDSLLSGPAGGVVGAAAVARRAGMDKIIALDMGGTSTDVSRFSSDFDYHDKHEVADVLVNVPSLRIETVAAGGGSICRIEDGLLRVGPESAGARPGPACYGYGGPLCLTDVNLLHDRLDTERFSVPLFPEESERRLKEMLDGTGRSREETLDDFLEIANDVMAGAIRKVSVREGYDPTEYAILAFGGAGGQHACGVAEKLGVRRVVSPEDAGLLSAYGLSQAVVERFAETQVLRLLTDLKEDWESMDDSLCQQAIEAMQGEGIARSDMLIRRKTAFIRYQGQDAPLEIEYQEYADLRVQFEERYLAVFGYCSPDHAVEVVSLRVIASTEVEPLRRETFPDSSTKPAKSSSSETCPVYRREDILPGSCVTGPAVVSDAFGTLVVEDGWVACKGDQGSLLLDRSSSLADRVPQKGGADRELFANRFCNLVEEMGAQLERTALSTNVKERLDFSCALLDSKAQLVANAPHVPVHLGALGVCAREINSSLSLRPGDVVVSNHPAYGGSHLPDVTVLAPIHDETGVLLAFVANRAHHAEIGGIRPGSMSPEASVLAEEGVVIEPTYLFQGGRSRVEEVALLFREGAWPSRRPDENRADLLAQVAAIRRGAEAMEALVDQYGTDLVMKHLELLRERSSRVCREFLVGLGEVDLFAEQLLDDGSPIVVRIVIREGRARIDFTGTASRHPGNLNATAAITRSAVVYVLRLLAGQETPLNEGLLEPVEIILPDDSLLAPRFPSDPQIAPAVSGGNVEVSQRLVDTLLLAFGEVACSQGTMNNVIFGDATRSHYETVAGGAGAGVGFNGTSGVHVHMTNTAITDPEILELGQPVRLERFSLREGSGGAGSWVGGDGVEREYVFEESLSVSLLTQRRLSGPAGILGGEDGRPGEQYVLRKDGTRENLSPVDHVEVNPGDRLVLLTPGGGGAGDPETLA